tara:strand:+ start:552 stop:767 length:216 start_codon:yes stop_codon:yes gene_type:complete
MFIYISNPKLSIINLNLAQAVSSQAHAQKFISNTVILPNLKTNSYLAFLLPFCQEFIQFIMLIILIVNIIL